jgi:type VI secretion system protein ImpA
MRVNSVLALADNDTVLRSLKRASLTDSKTFGRLSLRDISVASGEMSAPADMDNVPDMQSVSAAFQDTDNDLLSSRLGAARSALENVEAINAVFDSETPGMGPDLDPLVRILKQISSQLAEATGGDAEAEAGEEFQDDGGNSSVAPSGSGGGGAMGAINSPNDVQNALDRIIAYYQRSEPSSPVPILLVRAKRLVGADFLSIVKDMAPHGVENVNLIGGIEEDGY